LEQGRVLFQTFHHVGVVPAKRAGLDEHATIDPELAHVIDQPFHRIRLGRSANLGIGCRAMALVERPDVNVCINDHTNNPPFSSQIVTVGLYSSERGACASPYEESSSLDVRDLASSTRERWIIPCLGTRSGARLRGRGSSSDPAGTCRVQARRIDRRAQRRDYLTP